MVIDFTNWPILLTLKNSKTMNDFENTLISPCCKYRKVSITSTLVSKVWKKFSWNFDIFWITCGILTKFSEMVWLMIILQVSHKKQCLTLSLDNTFFKNRREYQIKTLSLFSVKHRYDQEQVKSNFVSSMTTLILSLFDELRNS